MTKLLEWLSGLAVYFAIWFSLINNKRLSDTGSELFDNAIYFLPLITVFVFGMYSLVIVLWRVYCFNDCPEAAKELQKQIIEAREDLKSKGLQF